MIWGDIIIPDNLTINVHLHDAEDRRGLSAKIDNLTRLVELVLKKETIMNAALTRLTQEVEETAQVQASAIALLQGISAQIVEFKDSPAKLQKLADDLDTSATALADAIVQNTPAEEPSVEPPVEEPVEPPVEPPVEEPLADPSAALKRNW